MYQRSGKFFDRFQDAYVISASIWKEKNLPAACRLGMAKVGILSTHLKGMHTSVSHRDQFLCHNRRTGAVMAKLHLALVGLFGLSLEVLDFSLGALQLVQKSVQSRKL